MDLQENASYILDCLENKRRSIEDDERKAAYFCYIMQINELQRLLIEGKFVKSLLVLQNFSTARKSGKISHILKAFFVRHSSEYETSDSDRKVIKNLYSQMRIHMVR